MKTNAVFITLIAIRVIFPPIVFSVFHPFIAMLINEVILDGVISPYHFFRKFVPDTIKGHDKLCYDMPLDSWGFLNGLLPVFYKGNKFYHVFEGRRKLVLSLFVWKMIGYILAYKTRQYKWNLLFQNFYIAVYLAVGFCDFFKIDQKNFGALAALFIVVFVIREVYLVSINKTL